MIINTEIGSMGQQTPNNQKQEAQQPALTFGSGSLFGAAISRNVGSEIYNKLKAGLIEVYKTAEPQVEIKLMDLTSNEDDNLIFDCLIVSLLKKEDPSLGVAYHILLLEETGSIANVNNVYSNVNDPNRVNILRVSSDAFDKRLIESSRLRVLKEYPDIRSVLVDGCVIPVGFPVDDKSAIHKIALNTCLATNTKLDTIKPGFLDLNLVGSLNNSSLAINLSFNRKTINNIVGRPIRSDVVIGFYSRKNAYNQDPTIINSGNREMELFALTGYMDLLWNPAVSSNPLSYYPSNQPALTQKYSSRFILTDLQSPFSYTPSSILLATYASMSVKENCNWFQAFKPKATINKEIDITDIGALNVESRVVVPPGEENQQFVSRFNIKGDGVRLEDIGAYISAQIHPTPMMSIDVPEYGPQSWYLSMFLQAALGNKNAIQVIYNAANQLTNGKFGDYFNINEPMFVNVDERIHAGTWVDSQGNLRDIRDIDYVAVCNLVEKTDPKIIKDWSDTFLRTEYDLDKRLTERLKMIESFTNYTANVYGYYKRITFTSKFLDSLSSAIQTTGIPIAINTPMSSSDFNSARASASFANAAMLSQAQSFIASSGMGSARPFMNNSNFVTNRWF
jgi:hypothetical protein